MESVSLNRLLHISGAQCERFGGRIVYYPIQENAFKAWLIPSNDQDTIHILNPGCNHRFMWLCHRILSSIHKIASAYNYPYGHYHWYIQGQFHSVMDDGYLLEALFTALLSKTNKWDMDTYGLAMLASRSANIMDPHYFGFADIYATLLSIDHPDDLIYLDTLMSSSKYIHISDGDTIEILPFRRLLVNRIKMIESFSKAGKEAFETLGIFYPIHSLASVSSSELSENKDQLSKSAYRVATYVINQSEASDAIASYQRIKAFDLYRFVSDHAFTSIVTTRAGRIAFGHLIAKHPFCLKMSKIYPCGHYGIIFNWIKS